MTKVDITVIPNIDDIWPELPDTELKALDAAILWLERLAEVVSSGATDDEHVMVETDALLCIAHQAGEVACNLVALHDQLRPEEAKRRARVREAGYTIDLKRRPEYREKR